MYKLHGRWRNSAMRFRHLLAHLAPSSRYSCEQNCYTLTEGSCVRAMAMQITIWRGSEELAKPRSPCDIATYDAR
jgi:hypothetical protein